MNMTSLYNEPVLMLGIGMVAVLLFTLINRIFRKAAEKDPNASLDF
jgi:hypothetical protein